jgi:hypothetical protein
MKKNILALALSAATMSIVCLVASPSWSADQYGYGHNNQQRRIAQGVKSGELTRHERARLQHDQRQIKHFTHRAYADGHLNKWERRQLADMKKQANRHIYKAKHNRVVYDPCRPVVKRPHGDRHYPQYRATTLQHGAFSGAVVQPGVSVAWNIGLR